MRRSNILSMAAALVAMLVLALTAGAGRVLAQPQNPNCCTYSINVGAGIPAACYPITLVIEWGPGVTHAFTVAAPIVYTDVIPAPFAPCPPALPFNWVQVMPGGPKVALGGAGTVVLPCGYTLTYIATTDAAGCISIILI